MLTLVKVKTGQIWTDKNGLNHESYNWYIKLDSDRQFIIRPCRWSDLSVLEMLNNLVVDLYSVKVNIEDKEYTNFYLVHKRGNLLINIPIRVLFKSDFKIAIFLSTPIDSINSLNSEVV